MLNKLFNLFKRSEPVNPQITDSVTQAPYKIEAPADQVTETMTAAVKKNVAAKKPAAPKKPRVKKQWVGLVIDLPSIRRHRRHHQNLNFDK